jgi:hypothetical protein
MLYDLDLQMEGPKWVVREAPVLARTRALQTSYTLELAQDLKSIQGLDVEAELLDLVVVHASVEIANERLRLRNMGCDTAMFVPLEPVRFIDKPSFRPLIGFKTRYGVVPTAP